LAHLLSRALFGDVLSSLASLIPTHSLRVQITIQPFDQHGNTRGSDQDISHWHRMTASVTKQFVEFDVNCVLSAQKQTRRII
jgi:hypothetical protein